jgi:hypothetical protein
MRKKDSQRLVEIAVALNVGDEVHARHMAERLWKVRRWAAEQTWRAEAAKDDDRRGILEQIGASLDDALHALERLRRRAMRRSQLRQPWRRPRRRRSRRSGWAARPEEARRQGRTCGGRGEERRRGPRGIGNDTSRKRVGPAAGTSS